MAARSRTLKLSQKMLSLLRTNSSQPETKIGYLATVDIFRDLSSDEMKEIAESTAMTTCQAGKIFYSPNQYGDVIFILKKGKVQIYRMSSEGRKLVIETLGPGTIFGEMSLVGPRPVVEDELAYYGTTARYYLSARPGLTGLWQVSGRSDTTYAERVRLDRRYVSRWGHWRDLQILAKTVPALLSSRGAH